MNLTEREIQSVLTSPFFYKAVGVDEAAMTRLDEAELSRVSERQIAREQYEASARDRKANQRAGAVSEDEAKRSENEVEQIERLFPKWLAWSNPLSTSILDQGLTTEQLVARARPQILGRYDNGEVFAVRRRVDDGEIIMVTTGCYPLWNNIAADFEGSSMLIFHQILRHLLSGALPNHTLASPNAFAMSIDSRDEASQFKLLSPADEEPQQINVEALGADRYGLVLRALGRRGFYNVRCEGPAEGATSDGEGWSVTLAVNGPASESNLTSVTRSAFEDRLGLANVRWVEADEPISLEGTTYFGHDVWKYLMLAVLLCLALEMILLLPRVMGWMTGNPADSSAAANLADVAATGGNPR
jgi:hypothetical protein